MEATEPQQSGAVTQSATDVSESSFCESMCFTHFYMVVYLMINSLCATVKSGYSQFGHAEQEYVVYSSIHFHQQLE